jgi:hypothetical protein
VPAEGQVWPASAGVGIDRDLPGVDVGSDPGRLAGVVGPHRGGKAEVAAVRPLDRLCDRPVGDHGQRWAELLLVDDRGPVRDSGQDGRLVEVAVPVDRPAARSDPGAAVNRVADQAADPFQLGAVVEGPYWTPSSLPSPTLTCRAIAARAATTSSYWLSWT